MHPEVTKIYSHKVSSPFRTFSYHVSTEYYIIEDFINQNYETNIK